MDFATLIGIVAAGLTITTLSMRTMVPLRIAGISSNIAFITYSLLIGSMPILMLHSILFPLNIWRLFETRKLIADVRAASHGDLSMDWLKPFMNKRGIAAGEVLFRKGDDADRLFFIASGRLRLPELGIELAPGAVVGELGMLTPGRKRTQTLECVENGALLEICYDKIEELYFQNPTFGFYFLRLSSGRLLENIERANLLIAERDAEIARLRGA